MTSVLDSFLGLIVGAVLGGLVIFLITNERLKKMQRQQQARRITMLESIAEHIGKAQHVISKYTAVIAEAGPKAERLTAKQQNELNSLSNELVEIYQEIAIAESKLLLLGEKHLEISLKVYSSKAAQFRKQYYPGRYTDSEQMNTARKELNQAREQFYDLLSQRYDTMIARAD